MDLGSVLQIWTAKSVLRLFPHKKIILSMYERIMALRQTCHHTICKANFIWGETILRQRRRAGSQRLISDNYSTTLTARLSVRRELSATWFGIRDSGFRSI